MATFRKRLGRWQSIVGVKGYPARTQSFDSKSDAKLWSSNIELELHREKHGLRKKSIFTKNSDVVMIPQWRYHDIDTKENWKHAEIYSKYIK